MNLLLDHISNIVTLYMANFMAITGVIKGGSRDSVFPLHDKVCTELFTRLRLGFSYSYDHEFRHNFKYTRC